MKKIDYKKWGKEITFHNDDGYCGKVLIFHKGGKFSMHYHIKKIETWYVSKGKFILRWIDTEKVEKCEMTLTTGMSWHIPPGQPHQLEALEDSEIFEASTTDFESDNYRIEKGDNQK